MLLGQQGRRKGISYISGGNVWTWLCSLQKWQSGVGIFYEPNESALELRNNLFQTPILIFL